MPGWRALGAGGRVILLAESAQYAPETQLTPRWWYAPDDAVFSDQFFGTELVPEAISAVCLLPLLPFVSPPGTASGAGWPSGGGPPSVVLVQELHPA